MASKPLIASRLDQCQATSFKSDGDKCEWVESEGGIHFPNVLALHKETSSI